MRVEAYAPFGSGVFPYRGTKINILEDPVIVKIAKAHNKTPAQIILNWHLQRGVIVIPKTSTAKRLPENADVFDFELSKEEVQ